MSDRTPTAFVLALVVCAAALVVVLGRRRPPPPQALPEPDDDPVCRARGCSAPATRALPEARLWRPLAALLPRWEVATDAEGDPAVCAAHHGALVAALVARAALERAALEEHLAARHRELVAWALGPLQRDHAIAPPRVAPRSAEESSS